MKKTNHFYRFCALALSCLLLISLLPVTQVLADGDGAIHIKSAETYDPSRIPARSTPGRAVKPLCLTTISS